jgi:hypothetical protein
MATRPLIEILSAERLAMWARAKVERDGRPILAARLLPHVESGDCEAAEQALDDCLPAYFHNLTATQKRRYADSVSVALCASDDAADELFEWMKERNLTGRTRQPRESDSTS